MFAVVAQFATPAPSLKSEALSGQTYKSWNVGSKNPKWKHETADIPWTAMVFEVTIEDWLAALEGERNLIGRMRPVGVLTRWTTEPPGVEPAAPVAVVAPEATELTVIPLVAPTCLTPLVVVKI